MKTFVEHFFCDVERGIRSQPLAVPHLPAQDRAEAMAIRHALGAPRYRFL
jgi:hypothetical protein